MRLFQNRVEAARELSGHLAYLKAEQPIVVGIPNGGLQVASIVAESFGAPLDILLVKKLAVPGHPTHIVGAVDEHGRISMIQTTARWHHMTSQQMIEPARQAFVGLQERRVRFRAILPESDVRGRTVIIADHGVASGATMLAAIAAMRDRGARKVVVAAPAGCGESIWQLHDAANIVVIPHTPPTFKGIDHFYEVFEEINDDLVAAMLHRWAQSRPPEPPGVKTFPLRLLNSKQRVLHCELDMPPGAARGSGPYPAVIFAHGFESDARSPRSMPISRRLAKRGVIGVRMDFTGHGRSEGTPDDCTSDQMLDDLRAAYENVRLLQEVDPLRIGLNGSGSGGMVALRFAAQEPRVKVLVIRGPVSGGEIQAAEQVIAPTLIIHAEYDTALRETAEALDHRLAATHQMLKIPDASRLFSDPISLELMVGSSVDWLVDHLRCTVPMPKSANPASVASEPPEVQTLRPANHEAPTGQAR